ncbi:hypothetical protein RhiirA1_485345, partial [Rhizophagus irregularis]
MNTERDDQSAFYIAEAGLVEMRTSLHEIAKSAYSETLETYNAIEDPVEKSEYDFEGNFIQKTKSKINALYFNGVNPTTNFISENINK